MFLDLLLLYSATMGSFSDIFLGMQRSMQWSNDIMTSDMLSVHSSVCALMYSRNAVLFHLPRIMILVGCMSFRNKDIAAAYLTDLLPISDGSKPNVRFPPSLEQVSLIVFNVNSLVIMLVLILFKLHEHNQVLSLAPLTKWKTLMAALPNRSTGQREGSPVRL